jgi:putative ABC transport system permease protein
VLYRTYEANGRELAHAYDRLRVLRSRVPALGTVQEYDEFSAVVRFAGPPVAAWGVAATEGLRRLLQVKIVAGLGLGPRGTSDALVSARFARRFGTIGRAIGRPLDISGRAFTIVGVFSGAVRLPDFVRPAVWVRLGADPNDGMVKRLLGIPWQRVEFLRAVGAIRRGATIKQVAQEAAALPTPTDETGSKMQVRRLEAVLAAPYLSAAGLVSVSALMALLLALVGLVGLVLARAAGHRGEAAVRLALGASRDAMIREGLIAGVGLGAVSTAAGLWLAWELLSLVPRLVPDGVLPVGEARIGSDGVMLATLLGVAVAVLRSVIPAWYLATVRPEEALRTVGHGPVAGPVWGRVQKWIVAVEVAIAVTLLACAGFAIQGLSALLSAPVGFQPNGLWVASVALPQGSHPGRTRTWHAFADSVRRRLRRSGVTSVVAIWPPGGPSLKVSYAPGSASVRPGSPIADYQPVGAGYFTLLHLPLVAGRPLARTDSARAPEVCVVNRALALAAFGGRSPVGRHLSRYGLGVCMVVGVVADTRASGPLRKQRPTIYIPFSQLPESYIQSRLSFLARGAGAGPALARAVRLANAGVAVSVTTESSLLRSRLGLEYVAARLLPALGLAALALAGIGIAGLSLYSVRCRATEIRVRVALGAGPQQVVQLVIGSNLAIVAEGALLGLGGAWMIGVVLSHELPGLPPFDARVALAVAGAVIAAACLACGPAAAVALRDPSVKLLRQG